MEYVLRDRTVEKKRPNPYQKPVLERIVMTKEANGKAGNFTIESNAAGNLTSNSGPS